MTRGDKGQFIFRQQLTRDDVVHILNESGLFHFGELEIKAEGLGETAVALVKTQEIHTEVSPPTNEALLEAYPKLEIKSSVLVATMIVNMQDWNANPPDGVITMVVNLRNLRLTPINVDLFQLEVTANLATRTVHAEVGDIFEKMHISKEGELRKTRKLERNLADRSPLPIREAVIAGHLQFILPEMGASLLNHPVSYRLIITDVYGEKHLVSGKTGRVER